MERGGKKKGRGIIREWDGGSKEGVRYKKPQNTRNLMFYVLCFVQGTGRSKKRGRGGDGKGR